MPYLHYFTALDFETFTPERSSACAIGLVKVVDGHIVHKFYSLINPIPDSRPKNNSLINGITPEMVAVAPTFKQLWPTIKEIIGQDVIVCHNASFDHAVWDEQMRAYCTPEDLHKYHFVCTFEMTGLSLVDACAKHKIEIGHHHDALDDAEACAKIMIAESGHVIDKPVTVDISEVFKTLKARKYDRATLDPIDDTLVEDKETPFFHAKTVVTGTFTAYPERNELGKRLQALGADINTSISRKTNIVVVGEGAGPSKLKKIEELLSEGVKIRLIYEPELVSILSKIQG